MKKTKLMLSVVMVMCLAISVFAMPNDFKGNCEKDKKCPAERCDMDKDDIMFVLTMFDCPQPDKDFCHKEKFKFGCHQPGNDLCHKHHFNGDMKEHRNFGEHKNFRPWEDKLNLTDEQKAKLKGLKEKEFALKKDFFDKIKSINEEFANENPNEKNIKSMQKEAKKLSQEIIDNYINNKKQLREVLSFEQYSKMFTKKTRFDMFAEKLNLTDEQKEKVKTLFEQNKEKSESMKKAVFEDKIKLEKELEKETVDTNAVNNLSNEISQLSQDIVKNNINMKVELKNILTAEQYNKLNEKPKAFKQHHKK